MSTSSSSPQGARKGLYIETYGCQMNVYDTERMRDVLAPLGYARVDAPADADLVILNTCHIREKATEKVYSEVGRLRAHKQNRRAAGQDMTIVVAGCVAQAQGEEIMARAGDVDLAVGPQSYHRLPELIARAARARGERLIADFTPEEKFDALPERVADGVSAFVSVQEGCDKFCTFCVVPYTRGGEYSRPLEDVLRETRALAAQGVREITFIGQNVNAYHGAGESGDARLADLIRAAAAIPGVERIRYTTSHPLEMDDDLIALHGEEPKLMPFLHLPVQSGSDRILKAMNRRHTAADYLRIVEKLRAARPDIAFSTDVIVGFPGERDADFGNTLALVRAVGFAQAYSFKYSPRPGTPAAAMHGAVAPDVMSARLAQLQALLAEQQRAFNAAFVGADIEVLISRSGRKPGQVQGRSPYLQAVHFDGDPARIGALARVRVIAASQNSLTAREEGAAI